MLADAALGLGGGRIVSAFPPGTLLDGPISAVARVEV
jgi:hypothetical protein